MAKGESGFQKSNKSQNNGYAPGDSPYQSMMREARQIIRDAGYNPDYLYKLPEEEFSSISNRHYTAIYNSVANGETPTNRFSKATGEELLRRVAREKINTALYASHSGDDDDTQVRYFKREMSINSAIEEYVKKKLKRK